MTEDFESYSRGFTYIKLLLDIRIIELVKVVRNIVKE